LIPRILITLVGTALILVGITEMLLVFSGELTEGVVTDIRREGGERNESVAGRYTYSIGYRFTLPDGREINGAAKRIRNGVYLKASGEETVSIRYFPAIPYVNALEEDTGLGARQLTFIVAGGALVYLINIKKAKKGHSSARKAEKPSKT
jgi:hypothetical protein